MDLKLPLILGAAGLGAGIYFLQDDRKSPETKVEEGQRLSFAAQRELYRHAEMGNPRSIRDLEILENGGFNGQSFFGGNNFGSPFFNNCFGQSQFGQFNHWPFNRGWTGNRSNNQLSLRNPIVSPMSNPLSASALPAMVQRFLGLPQQSA